MSAIQYLVLILFGGLIGGLSGLLGLGGGMLMIPGMMLLFGFSQQEAQGTSLAVMIPPIGIFAAMVYYKNGYVHFPVVGAIALGFLVGAYFGARIVPHIAQDQLRLGFGALLLYTGFLFVIQAYTKRTSSALPAGVATVGAFVVAALVGKIRQRLKQPPDDEPESLDYHI